MVLKMVKYMEYFKMFCKENEMWGMITEQILLGQLNPTRYIDFAGQRVKPKISAIIIDKSSTGKDQAGDVLYNVLELMGLKVSKIMDIQEAGLTGTIKKNEIVYGKLKTDNILIFPECNNLFVGTEHKTTLVTSLQGAIEKKGYVSKRVSGMDIDYHTDVSFLMMSVPFRKINQIIVDKGIFQRCMISYMNRDYDNIKGIYNSITNSNKINTNLLQDYKDKINEAIRVAPETIMIDEYTIEIIKKKTIAFFDKEREKIIDNFNREMFDSYLIRSGDNMTKMAVNIMFRDKKQKLDLECYDIPMKIFEHHIESVRDMFNGVLIRKKFIPGQQNVKKYDKERVLKLIKEHDGKQTELYNKICKSENIVMNTAINIYREVMNI